MGREMKILAWSTSVALGLVLTACDSGHDGRSVGQKVDQAIASANDAASQVKQTARRGLEQAAQATKETSREVANKADDAAITAAVKAGIAKDDQLSALHVDVDTENGHVSLSGTAPSQAAKQRAQAIAMAEKGVTGVDNRLTVANEHQ